MKKISIIMPVYNSALFISQAIQSILNQTYSDFELIIINDSSTDDSMRIIKTFKDKRITIITNKIRKGVAYSLNKGILHAKGEYIARMDSDDIANIDRFKRQILYLQKHSDIVLLGTAVDVIDVSGKKISHKIMPQTYSHIRSVILRYNPFIHPSVIMRRNVIDAVGMYNEFLDGAEDYDLFLRIVAQYKVANMKDTLLQWRWGIGRTFSIDSKKTEYAAIMARIYAITRYHYPVYNSIHLIKPLLSYFIPTKIKQCYRP